MREAVISIRGTDVRSLKFSNNFTAKPGEKLSIKVKNAVAVKVNTASPTNATVAFKFEAYDENNALSFELDTLTAVSSSTYINDFENYIKDNYVSTIQLTVNERIRALSAALGMNIATPPVSFATGEEGPDTDDNLVDFTAKN